MIIILYVAAGILLAFLLLPFLGPIVMVLLVLGAIALFIYLALAAVASGQALMESAGNAAKSIDASRKASRKYIIRTSPSYCDGLRSIRALLILQQLQKKPIGFWYAYVLNERFRNCSMSGIFRVDDKLNREHLEKYLQKTAQHGSPSPEAAAEAEALCRKILSLHDELCSAYPPKSKTNAKK